MRALWQSGFSPLQRAALRIGKAVVEDYPSRKRRGAGAEARLAEAMVRYAKLCLTAGGQRDLDEAAIYLDRAASLYKQVGRPEDAAKALALKPEAESDAPGG